MDTIIKLNKSGGIQAYRVLSDRYGDAVLMYDTRSEFVETCTECDDPRECYHADLLCVMFGLKDNDFHWMPLITYVLHHYSKTNHRMLWGLITHGLIFRDHPLHLEMRSHTISVLNPLVWKHNIPHIPKEDRERCLKEIPELKHAMEKKKSLKKEYSRLLIKYINATLDSLTVEEAGYLSLLPLGFEDHYIDEKMLSPKWRKGRNWVVKNVVSPMMVHGW